MNPFQNLVELGMSFVAARINKSMEKDELAALGVAWDGNDKLRRAVINVLLWSDASFGMGSSGGMLSLSKL